MATPRTKGFAMDDAELAIELARAGLGVNYLILGQAQHGWYGIIKDAFAMRDAALEIPPGPISEILHEAGRTMNTQGADIPELHVNVTARGLASLKHAGQEILAAVGPTLASLDEAAAAQACTWLLGIGERIANASRDDFRGQRISDQERHALDDLRTWLADPTGPPLAV